MGLLKAAELHGAAHQAVMEFQVVTNRPAEADRGRPLEDCLLLPEGVRRGRVGHQAAQDRRRAHAAGEALNCTAWDLIRYAQASGGINQIATVLTEQAQTAARRLAALAPSFRTAATLQRLGFLLDRVGQHAPAYALAPIMAVAKATWVELDPTDVSLPDFAPPVLERDPRWKVVVRRAPEPDE